MQNKPILFDRYLLHTAGKLNTLENSQPILTMFSFIIVAIFSFLTFNLLYTVLLELLEFHFKGIQSSFFYRVAPERYFIFGEQKQL